MAKIFITGGAYQGKLRYAKEYYHISENEIFDFAKEDLDVFLSSGNLCDFFNDCQRNKKCFYHCHLFVKWAVKNQLNVIEEWEKLSSILCDLGDWCVIMDEIGNGIIPIDKWEREYREQVGIFGCYIAKNAKEVIRVFCGIGNKIK